MTFMEGRSMDPRNSNGRIAMEQKRVRIWARVCAAIVGVAALAVAVVAAADPPSRVARLAHVEGTVSFAPAGDDQWVQASVNRPLVAGDRLWFDQGSRGEVQMTNAALRFGPLTNVSLPLLGTFLRTTPCTRRHFSIRSSLRTSDTFVIGPKRNAPLAMRTSARHARTTPHPSPAT